MNEMQASKQEIEENISAFRAALEAKAPQISSPKLGHILLALDQSNQDPTAEQLALTLAERSGAVLATIYAYEGESDEARKIICASVLRH